MIINNLFPSPVAFFSFRDLNNKEKKFVDSLIERPNAGNTSSENSYVLKSKELSDIKTFLDACISEYVEEVYQPKEEISVYITQSWFNWTRENQYHHIHGHRNSFISGIYYTNADEEFDKVYFHKDKDYRSLRIFPKNYNVWNSESWFFKVKTGDVILFPSSLIHSVESVLHKNVRVSLAFNTFVKGYLGQEDELTGLHL